MNNELIATLVPKMPHKIETGGYDLFRLTEYNSSKVHIFIFKSFFIYSPGLEVIKNTHIA